MLETLKNASILIAQAQKSNNNAYIEAMLDSVALLLHLVIIRLEKESGRYEKG